MKQMGLFYNKFFDCLSVVLNDESNEPVENYRVQAMHIQPDVIEIKYHSEVKGYNILNASKYFQGNELVNGINNDNSQVVEMVITMIKTVNSALVDYNKTEQFVVGTVVSKSKHPKSDHLSICQVDIAKQKTQIVCGAANVAVGQNVVVALPGAVMPNGVKILPNSLLGEESNGMLCSWIELGLPSDGIKGIAVLDINRFCTGHGFWGEYYGWQN